ncbi:MAG: hypothetical protein JW818_17360 [Pirellulales bacterium]|nr:hypothetical protein [Pirellulales bacterium]
MTAEFCVKWLLRILALTTVPALLAAVAPQDFLAGLLDWMQPGFSAGLLESYIMRCLMGL